MKIEKLNTSYDMELPLLLSIFQGKINEIIGWLNYLKNDIELLKEGIVFPIPKKEEKE